MSDTEQTAVRGGGIRLPLWLIRPVINELPQGESKLGVVGYQIGADTSEIAKCSFTALCWHLPILPLRSVWVSPTAYLNAAHRTTERRRGVAR